MKKKLSRQRAWQLAKKAVGLCPLCGQQPRINYVLCDSCNHKQRVKRNKLLKVDTKTNRAKVLSKVVG